MNALITMLKKGQLFLLLRLSLLTKPFYKLSFIAAAIENDVLKLLAKSPLSLIELADEMGIHAENHTALKAWLQVGIRVGEILFSQNKYALAGVSAWLMRVEENDALQAITEEVATLHHKLILDTPKKLKAGEKWGLSDQDGELIARSSRIVETLQTNLIQSTFAADKPLRLLEVGCGSGIYIKVAAEHNPQLTAVGVELQDDVAVMARKNLTGWGLHERVWIESGDIRQKNFDAEFDIVTLYNNIYYFPVKERVELIMHLSDFLKPGGMLLLVTGVQGGQPLMELLNLWGAATEGCDRLPDPLEMTTQMQAAGLQNVHSRNLLPGDSFYAFMGYKGE